MAVEKWMDYHPQFEVDSSSSSIRARTVEDENEEEEDNRAIDLGKKGGCSLR